MQRFYIGWNACASRSPAMIWTPHLHKARLRICCQRFDISFDFCNSNWRMFTCWRMFLKEFVWLPYGDHKTNLSVGVPSAAWKVKHIKLYIIQPRLLLINWARSDPACLCPWFSHIYTYPCSNYNFLCMCSCKPDGHWFCGYFDLCLLLFPPWKIVSWLSRGQWIQENTCRENVINPALSFAATGEKGLMMCKQVWNMACYDSGP